MPIEKRSSRHWVKKILKRCYGPNNVRRGSFFSMGVYINCLLGSSTFYFSCASKKFHGMSSENETFVKFVNYCPCFRHIAAKHGGNNMRWANFSGLKKEREKKHAKDPFLQYIRTVKHFFCDGGSARRERRNKNPACVVNTWYANLRVCVYFFERGMTTINIIRACTPYTTSFFF